MKRFLSLALTLILLCTAVVQVSASETNETRDINDYLTIHYDFEGADYTEALKDKATRKDKDGNVIDTDETDDDLVAYLGSSTFNNTFLLHTEKGTVETKIRTDMGSNNSLATVVKGGTLPTTESDTYTANVGEGTWFVRFRMNTVPEGDACLIDLRDNGTNNTGRPLYVFYDISENKLGVNISDEGVQNIDLPVAYDFNTSPYLNVAMVRCKAPEGSTDGSYYYLFYIAYGNPTKTEDWLHGETGYSAKIWVNSLISSQGIPLYLFQQVAWKPVSNLEIDDVRYYDIALTSDEVATITTSDSFDGIEDPNAPPAEEDTSGGGDTTTPEDDTTAAPEDNTTVAPTEDTTNGTSENTDNSTNDEKSGCASSIVGGTALACVCMGAALLFKKRKEN